MKKTPEHNRTPPTLHPDCVTENARAVDEYKDFRMEPTGHYALIRVNKETGQIEVAVCNEGREILRIFKGTKGQDLYHAIFEYERTAGVAWFTEKTHIAYLGKELKKAEMFLRGEADSYWQE